MYMFCSREMHIPRNIFPGTEFSELDAVGEEAKGCLETSVCSDFKLFAQGQWLFWCHQQAAASVQVEYHNCIKESPVSVHKCFF
jgi:hypothetical protein